MAEGEFNPYFLDSLFEPRNKHWFIIITVVLYFI